MGKNRKNGTESPTRGRKIKERITAMGITQAQLAERMDASEARISRIVAGADITMTEMGLLTHHLHIPMRYLFDWSPELEYPRRPWDMRPDFAFEIMAWLASQSITEWVHWHSLMVAEHRKYSHLDWEKRQANINAWLHGDNVLSAPMCSVTCPVDAPQGSHMDYLPTREEMDFIFKP